MKLHKGGNKKGHTATENIKTSTSTTRARTPPASRRIRRNRLARHSPPRVVPAANKKTHSLKEKLDTRNVFALNKPKGKKSRKQRTRHCPIFTNVDNNMQQYGTVMMTESFAGPIGIRHAMEHKSLCTIGPTNITVPIGYVSVRFSVPQPLT